MYLAAERLACAEEPEDALLQQLIIRLDMPNVHPLEAIIIRGLLVQAAAMTVRHETVTTEDGKVTTVVTQNAETSDGGIGFGLWQVIKIIFFIGVIGHLLSRFMH
ncbi:hypothetical protein TM63_09650 [Salmonella enterica subsp. salamae serovar 42:f,g,t:--]|nr:hypothetical protein TM63_09650 [Salmonella enterica subsp. salamae serovar 42:f,g,t:--]